MRRLHGHDGGGCPRHRPSGRGRSRRARLRRRGRRDLVGVAELVADPVAGDQAAALVAGADGRFLYAGLRGSNRIAVLDAATLAPVGSVPCGGDWPRHLAVAGDLLFVANQLSSTVSVLRIDPISGIPTPVIVACSVPSPTFLLPTRALDLAVRESLIK